MIRLPTSAIILSLFALLAVPAQAQAQAQDGQNPYTRCAQIEGDGERLACFDATYAAQVVVIAEREERETVAREEVFGFRDRDDAIERTTLADASITATVSEVLQGARRSQYVMLDSGQLWREIDGSTLRNRVREGWVATISRHWSGAYEMRFEGRSGYLRVTRVQ